MSTAADSEGLDAALRALAQPNRRQLLRLVSQRERSVTELQGELGLSQPAVSKHLVALKAASLVTSRGEGNRRLYSVRTEGLQAVEDFINTLWPSRLNALRDLVLSDLDEESTDGQ